MKEVASVDKPLSPGGVFPKERRQAAWSGSCSCSGLGEEGTASALGSKEGILGKGWLWAQQVAMGHALRKGRHVPGPTELLGRSSVVRAQLGGMELGGTTACGRGRVESGRPGTAHGSVAL